MKTPRIIPRKNDDLPAFDPSSIQRPEAEFPPAWVWFVDEAVPAWVKKAYSPRESWKDKPFTQEDARFFFKGISDLSDLFTEERARGIQAYFNHPKYRSAYLLYFLPLQAAKFVSLFQMHEAAIDAALAHAQQTGKLRVLDLGAGPGTASIALLLSLLGRRLAMGQSLPQIELQWVDQNREIMQDGQALVKQLSESFPKLRGKVTVETQVGPWWKARGLGESEPFSLILLGHVLNESSGPRSRWKAEQAPPPVEEFHEEHGEELDKEFDEEFDEESDEERGADQSVKPARHREKRAMDPAWLALWNSVFKNAHGAGVLMVEPAARMPSQNLSRLRDHLLQSEIAEPNARKIWGPCPHAEACPLAEGRDWCHFSVPAQVPGTWFKDFSKNLGSERQWLKFSYLWFASPHSKTLAPTPARGYELVISDPLRKTREAAAEVLLCEPETPGRLKLPASAQIWRGDWIRLRKP